MKFVKIISAVLLLAALLSSCTVVVKETKTAEAKTTAVTTEPTAEPTAEPTTAEPTATAEPTSAEPTETSVPEPHVTTILLDAGHGFVDDGCVPEALKPYVEKEITMKFARMLKEMLEAYGYKVILTHDETSFPSCAEIAALCDKLGVEYNPLHPKYWVENSNFDIYERLIWENAVGRRDDCDLFISLHVDSYPADTTITGSGIYYCTDTDYSKDSRKFAAILDSTLRLSFPDRKIRTEGFDMDNAYAVTKCSEMPSVLVEMAYGSSPEDAERLKGTEWAEEFVSAVTAAIMTFLG